ncbi:hypothetical protein GIB67_034143 [Kingdonia uniflora]|uniref:Uncharacterized protein n=1 Tax=Kingdonia uniflora TaxID=39325 RepID=A0A7J7P4J7_9MAGN|nr:hypothetical protein GIB67_034143 [Kingdonia uniflora]
MEKIDSTPSGRLEGMKNNSNTQGRNGVADADSSKVLTIEEAPFVANTDIAMEPTNKEETLEGDAYLMVIHKGWVTLAKAILNSIPIHNMAVYKWSRLLIKEGDNILKNYIWTGDPTKRKGVTLKWEKGTKDWAIFLKSKFSTKSGDTIRNHKPSTIWSGIQTRVALSKSYIGWLIGDGKKIDFWRDTWATKIPLMEYIELPINMWK